MNIGFYRESWFGVYSLLFLKRYFGSKEIFDVANLAVTIFPCFELWRGLS